MSGSTDYAYQGDRATSLTTKVGGIVTAASSVSYDYAGRATSRVAASTEVEGFVYAPQPPEREAVMEFWGCSRWNGTTTMLQGGFLLSLAVAALFGGAVVVTIPWRPRSRLSKLPRREALWIGLMMISASLGMLSLVIPPMLGFNRCP